MHGRFPVAEQQTETAIDLEQLKTLLKHTMGADRHRLRAELDRNRDKPHSLPETALRIAESAEKRRQRLENLPRPSYPEDLPISSRKDEIVRAIRENQVIILSGETGSGKSHPDTQNVS